MDAGYCPGKATRSSSPSCPATWRASPWRACDRRNHRAPDVRGMCCIRTMPARAKTSPTRSTGLRAVSLDVASIAWQHPLAACWRASRDALTQKNLRPAIAGAGERLSGRTARAVHRHRSGRGESLADSTPCVQPDFRSNHQSHTPPKSGPHRPSPQSFPIATNLLTPTGFLVV